MTEIKLKKLHRGYVLTDFEGNEIGIKDSVQAMEEVEKLLGSDEKSVQSTKQSIEQSTVEEPLKKTRNTAELHRTIFEKAKEQIELTGKVSPVKISRELEINNSTVHLHIRKMSIELDALIKKRQDEMDKHMIIVETRDIKSDKIINEDTPVETENVKIDQ